jgi:hypothetical protein
MTKSPLENLVYLQHTTTTRVKPASKNYLGTKKIWVLFKPPWAIHTTPIHGRGRRQRKTCTKHDTKQVQLGFCRFACLGNTQRVKPLGEYHQEQLLIHTCFNTIQKSGFKGAFFIQVNPICSSTSTSNAPTYHLTKKS